MDGWAPKMSKICFALTSNSDPLGIWKQAQFPWPYIQLCWGLHWMALMKRQECHPGSSRSWPEVLLEQSSSAWGWFISGFTTVIPWLYHGLPPYGEMAATTSHSAASRLQSHNSSLGDRGDPVAGSLSQRLSDPCTHHGPLWLRQRLTQSLMLKITQFKIKPPSGCLSLHGPGLLADG